MTGHVKQFYDELVEAGFKPIGMTTFLCEETAVFETEEEADRAAEMFLPNGWYYSKENIIEARVHYRHKFGYCPKMHWIKN
jgi:hypothetical protein